MIGAVGILNVGAGDTKLSFDPANPQERIRAARIVKDMIRRGYALLVDSGKRDAHDRPVYTRAYDFDEEKCEYIIADFDPRAAEDDDDDDEPTAAASPGAAPAKEPTSKPGRRRVKAENVSSIAVARTAGG